MNQRSSENRFSFFRNSIACTSILLCCQAGANAQALINGSFELGPDPGTFTNIFGGSNVINGWTVTGDGIDYVRTIWVSSDGERSLDLDGSAGPPYPHGGVSQSISTAPGTTYTVFFDMAGNPVGGVPLKQMRVSANGQFGDFTFDTSGKTLSSMGWDNMSWSFVADATTTALTFQSLTVGTGIGWGPALDNVRISAVPETSSLMLLIAGGIVFGATIAVRRQTTLGALDA